jgi:arsenate reductase (glutaredoxin)
MTIAIYHNPACGTSRNVLAAIRAAGHEPRIVEYLKTPPSRAELDAMLAAMGIGVRAILRQRGTPYQDLGLDDPRLEDDALFAAIAAHPILIERPIVVSPKGTALCRPAEKVAALL